MGALETATPLKPSSGLTMTARARQRFLAGGWEETGSALTGGEAHDQILRARRHGQGEHRLGCLKHRPLAGAEAVITEGGRVHRLGAGAATASATLGLGAVTALSKKSKASAIVAFADGTAHEKKLSGNREVRKAQAEAVKFNALARAATILPRTAGAGADRSGSAASRAATGIGSTEAPYLPASGATCPRPLCPAPADARSGHQGDACEHWVVQERRARPAIRVMRNDRGTAAATDLTSACEHVAGVTGGDSQTVAAGKPEPSVLEQ